MADKEANLLLRIKQSGGDVLDRVVITLGDIANIAKKVYGATIGLVADAIKNYREHEEAVNSLNQSLVQQGIYTKQLSEDYAKLADELQRKSKFNDEEIIQAQAVMQNYLGQTKISKELMVATLDLATAKKIDLQSAAEAVAKSVGTSTNALARQGLKMSENLTQTERLARVTEFLKGKFNGQAEAATKGLGVIDLLYKKFGELSETLGEKLAPTVELIVEYLDGMFNSLTKNNALIDMTVSGFKMFAKAAIVAMSEIKVFGDGIGAMFATIGASISKLAEGKVKEALEIFKAGDKAAAEDAVKTREAAAQKLNAIDDLSLAKHKANNDAKLQSDSDRNASQLAARLAQEELNKELDLARDEAKQFEKETFEMGMKDIALRHQMDEINKKIAMEKNHETQRALIQDRMAVKHKAMLEGERRREHEYAAAKMEIAQAVGNHAMELSNNLVALTKGNNRSLIIAQKALGIGMVLINGEIAKQRALAELGPIAGSIAYGIITANQLVSIALISGVTLAEGGIVKATAGGVPAIIGEGGRDEAVIPLEDGMPAGMGTNITIVVNGGLLGDQQSAREFAIVVDRELLRLRQANQSLAFDEAVT
jgi:hypothetical protein